MGIGTFIFSKKCNLRGNIMSLLYKDDFANKTDLTGKNYAFYKLFYSNAKIVNANKLILPATTLANYCYGNMFYGCTGLTTAPQLPATTLKNGCYWYMFSGCTGLTTPELPAITLAPLCYAYMFKGCTRLTTAPELPATTLANYCYQSMFNSCTGLIEAPELPATTLANNCYQQMFYGCTGLVTVPELPATALRYQCYQDMFNGCSKLNYIKALFTTTPSSSYTNNWVSGVSSTGTFVKSKDATWDVTGVNGIPSGWTVEYDGEVTTTTPEPNYVKTRITMEGLSLSSTTYINIYKNNSYVDKISMNVSGIELGVKVDDVLTYSLNFSDYTFNEWQCGRYVLSTTDTLCVTDEVFQKISEYGVISLIFEEPVTTTTPMPKFEGQEGNIYWEYNNSTRTLTISPVEGTDSSMSDYPESWYDYRSDIKTVIIENGVSSIGRYAFKDCYVLTSVEIPNSVTSIGSSAFSNCNNLTSIEIPNSVTSIGSSTFYSCNLTSITIPGSVTIIGGNAFESCTSLKELCIEDGEETLSLGYNYYDSSSIGKGLFYDCPLETLYLGRNISYNASQYYGYSPFYNKTALTSVTIGDNVTSIGEHAFKFCSSLKSVIIGSVTTIGSYAFESCRSLTSVTIPNSVTTIGDNAFYYCDNIKKIVLPESITSLGVGVFGRPYGTSSLTEITCLAKIPIIIQSGTFDKVNKSIPLYVPAESVDLYKNAYYWKEFTNIQAIID